MSYSTIQSHRSMALDLRRNEAYLTAMRNFISPDSVVLDLGAGVGILGFLAAKLGARSVYMVEPEDVISVAREIARANGLNDRIQFLRGNVENVELPERVDVILSVMTGNFLLQEDLLPSLFYARDNYLKPGGKLVPSEAVMEAAPVNAPELFDREIAAWSNLQLGIDLGSARAYAANTMHCNSPALSKAIYLGEPAALFTMDFCNSEAASCRAEVSFTIKSSGICHGIAGWFKMRLGDDWLSTAPHDPALHWSAVFLPADPPVTVNEGDRLRFRLVRPAFGNWSWWVESPKEQRRHSTFFAQPLASETVKKASLDYCPRLSQEGEAVSYVLDHANGSLSVLEIAGLIRELFPYQFPQAEKALSFVQRLTRWYG